MTAPTNGPVGLRRAKIPSVPNVDGQHGLKDESALRRLAGRRVREGNWILSDESDQQSWNTLVDGPKRGACLPRTLTSTLRRGSRKYERRSYACQKSASFPIRPW